MSFFSLVVRNLVRQRTRSVLTIVGIGIGITTVVALGAITTGLKRASEDIAHVGGADFMVAQNGAADLTFSTLTRRDLEAVQAVDGVERTWGMLLLVSRVGSNPFFFTFGVEPDELPRLIPRLQGGRLPQASYELAIGAHGASTLGVGVGGTLTIERRPFRVVGVYEGQSQWESSGGYATLATVQEIARKPGVLTAVYVVARPGVEPVELAASVEAASDRLAAISTADDYAEVDQGLRLLDAANLAISLLAVLIGAVGVMNTMIMSVFERTREIGILRAVGWRGSRIVRLILGESLLLCLVATVLGIAAGLGLTRAVALVPAVGSFLEPAYPPEIFVRALVIALGVAAVGALYPALRAVRLSPMEALRYE